MRERDVQELSRIYDIYDPWISATTERTTFTVTLRSGKEVTLHIPLGAAVEIEEAGHKIRTP